MTELQKLKFKLDKEDENGKTHFNFNGEVNNEQMLALFDSLFSKSTKEKPVMQERLGFTGIGRSLLDNPVPKPRTFKEDLISFAESMKKGKEYLNNLSTDTVAKGKVDINALEEAKKQVREKANEIIQGNTKEEEDEIIRKKAEAMNDLAIKANMEKISVLNTKQFSKKLPILNSTPRSTSSMADILGDAKMQKLYDSNPPSKGVNSGPNDFFQTGVKYKDDKPNYRTAYVCPRCNHSGRHYIPAHVDIVSCHNCQSKLLAEPATSKGFGFGEDYRDEEGNFFVANSLRIDNTPLYKKKGEE